MAYGSKHHVTHGLKEFFTLKVALGTLALLAVVVVAIVLNPRREVSRDLDVSEPPPSLQVGQGVVAGSFVDSAQGFIQYQPRDRQTFRNNLPDLRRKNPVPTLIPAGTNYLFTNKETTMGEIFRGIDPGANRLILAYYSSGEYGRSRGFYTYAKGPFTDTYEIKEQDLNTFIIPANRGVVVMTGKDTASYGLTPPTQMTSTALSVAANSSPLSPRQSGWVLLPSNTTKISDMLALYRNRVISAWALTSRNTFERVENLNTFSFTTYYLVWLKLSPM